MQEIIIIIIIAAALVYIFLHTRKVLLKGEENAKCDSCAVNQMHKHSKK